LKKKIISIIACTLIIATISVPMVGSSAMSSESVSSESYYGTINPQAHFAFSEKGSNLDNLAATDTVSLVGAEDARIFYLQKYLISGESDIGYVKISDNGGSSWSTLWEVHGTQEVWEQNFFELNNWLGEDIKIGFQYVTGENSVSQGWSVDKIVIVVDDENKYEEDFEEYDEGQAWGEWVIRSGLNPDNEPPYDPVIEGPRRAGENVPLTFLFTAADPDLDLVSYYIEWGDGETSGWTQFFPSGGAGYTEDHTYELEETYTIRAKAKDINNAESNWVEHKITIPRNRQVNNLFLIRNLESLFELIFNFFPILNNIIDFPLNT
jgi:hypothetical protein